MNMESESKTIQVAAYVRYSDHPRQRAESLEDQLRRCETVARQNGLEVNRDLVFKDAESGKEECTASRVGYKAMLAAWDSKQFDVLIVDEVSRLGRGRIELAKMHERIESTRVRVITCDGIDTGAPTWGLAFSVASFMAAQELDFLRHRVARAAVGILERGGALGAPAFGLRATPITRSDGTPDGVKWEVDPDTGPIVRDMYGMRVDGWSLMDIAAELHRRGVRTSRIRRVGGTYWRPSTVRALLRNPIFKGQFVYNGSPYTRARSKKLGKTVAETVYDRPECRIVSDEVWAAANPDRPGWVRRGNPSILAGLVRCGDCDGVMTVSHRGERETIYCASCAQAARVGATLDYAGNITKPVVQAALRTAFESLLISKDTLEAVRQGLRARLTRGLEGEREMAESRLGRARRARDRYRTLLGVVEDHELAAVRAKYLEAVTECKHSEGDLARLKKLAEANNRDVVEAQLAADPALLREKLFDTGAPVGPVRAMLIRIFPVVRFVGKHSRFGGLFEVHLAPGIAIAEATDTPVLDEQSIRLLIQVDRGETLPTEWHARLVQELPAPTWRAGLLHRRRRRGSR